MAPVRALIIDDDQNERESIAALLNAGGDDLQCQTAGPADDATETTELVLERLAGNGPRLLLLDYRLDDHPPEGAQAPNYRGGTIAGYVRDRDADLPIVLLTSEKKMHDYVERRPGVKGQFDLTVIKDEVAAEDGGARARKRLADYARTWQHAAGGTDDLEDTWLRLARLMKAPSEAIEQFRLLEAQPPRGDVAGELLHWLLGRAHRYRGPLIDDGTTRVTLGVTSDSFALQAVQEWLEPAKYKGGLQAFDRRWWSHLVAAQLAAVCGGARPIEASVRVAALSKKLDVELEYEPCNWCGGERTLHACRICDRATDAAHAVTPLGAPLPAWADPSVVCYRCVAEGRAPDLIFPPPARDIVAALVEDRMRPPK